VSSHPCGELLTARRRMLGLCRRHYNVPAAARDRARNRRAGEDVSLLPQTAAQPARWRIARMTRQEPPQTAADAARSSRGGVPLRRLDGRLGARWANCRPPGVLTREYFAGRRRRYISRPAVRGDVADLFAVIRSRATVTTSRTRRRAPPRERRSSAEEMNPDSNSDFGIGHRKDRKVVVKRPARSDRRRADNGGSIQTACRRTTRWRRW